MTAYDDDFDAGIEEMEEHAPDCPASKDPLAECTCGLLQADNG